MTTTDITPSDVLRAQVIRDGLAALGKPVPKDVVELAALDPWEQTRAEDRAFRIDEQEYEGIAPSVSVATVASVDTLLTAREGFAEDPGFDEYVRNNADLVARLLAPLLSAFATSIRRQ